MASITLSTFRAPAPIRASTAFVQPGAISVRSKLGYNGSSPTLQAGRETLRLVMPAMKLRQSDGLLATLNLLGMMQERTVKIAGVRVPQSNVVMVRSVAIGEPRATDSTMAGVPVPGRRASISMARPDGSLVRVTPSPRVFGDEVDDVLMMLRSLGKGQVPTTLSGFHDGTGFTVTGIEAKAP